MSRQSELKTVEKMIRLYCRKNHKSRELCAECSALVQYADDKLAKCSFGDDKPTCLKCHIHCYKPEMREKIREVMKFSGPRMILYDPVGAVKHALHGRAYRDKKQETRDKE